MQTQSNVRDSETKQALKTALPTIATAVTAILAATLAVTLSLVILFVAFWLLHSAGAPTEGSSIGESVPFIVWLALLMVAEAGAIATVHAIKLWFSCRLGKKGVIRISLGRAYQKAYEKLQRDHNYRFCYIFVMVVITWSIALAKPGPPLLEGYFDKFSSWATSWIGLHYFLYGNDPISSAPPATAVPYGTWFWWHAAGWLTLIAFILFLIIFSEELWALTKGVFKGIGVYLQKRRDDAAATKIAIAQVAPVERAPVTPAPVVVTTNPVQVSAPAVPVTTATIATGIPGTSGSPVVNVNTEVTSVPPHVPETGIQKEWWKLLFTSGALSLILDVAIEGWVKMNRMKRGIA